MCLVNFKQPVYENITFYFNFGGEIFILLVWFCFCFFFFFFSSSLKHELCNMQKGISSLNFRRIQQDPIRCSNLALFYLSFLQRSFYQIFKASYGRRPMFLSQCLCVFLQPSTLMLSNSRWPCSMVLHLDFKKLQKHFRGSTQKWMFINLSRGDLPLSELQIVFTGS